MTGRMSVRVFWHLSLGHQVTKYTPTREIANTETLNFCQTCRKFL